MRRRGGFQLLAALQQRELTGAHIFTAQLMPQLIRNAKAHIQKFLTCTSIDDAKEILLELKYLALLDIECVIDFYCNETWSETQLGEEQLVVLRPLIASDIKEIVAEKQYPGLCIYLCKAVGLMQSTLDLGLPDIRQEFRLLEQAAAGKGKYATIAAYLLFIIYAQEKIGELNNLCFNQLFINACHALAARINTDNELMLARLDARKSIAELGSEMEIGILRLQYCEGNEALGIPADLDQAAYWRARARQNKAFLQDKIKQYYTLACQSTISNRFLILEHEEHNWHIFNIIKIYADIIGGKDAEHEFTCEVNRFKRSLLDDAMRGNIRAMHLLVKLADLQAKVFFNRNNLPESYLQIITTEFSDINLIEWSEKIVTNDSSDEADICLRAQAARRLASCCTSSVRRVQLLEIAAEFGCSRSLIDLGVMALELNDDERAVVCFNRVLAGVLSVEILHRLHTAFNNIDALSRVKLLPVYFCIYENLIKCGEAFKLGKIITLVSALNDPLLAERWRDIRRMYDNEALDHAILHELIQDTVTKLTAAVNSDCNDDRLLKF